MPLLGLQDSAFRRCTDNAGLVSGCLRLAAAQRSSAQPGAHDPEVWDSAAAREDHGAKVVVYGYRRTSEKHTGDRPGMEFEGVIPLLLA